MSDSSASNSRAAERTQPRREANPYPLDNLTPEQRNAIEQISGLILHTLDALKTHKEGRSDRARWYDADRRSQLVLLSGKRGTGKTSTLLSLYNMMTGEDPIAKQERERKSEIDTLYQQRDRLLWLEPLDLDPVPAGSNLIAAVLARIQDKLEPHKPTSGARSPTWENFDKVVRQLISTWVPHLEEQKSGLDSVVYISEVNRLERERTGLHGRANNAIQKVLSECFPRGGSPLFILCIDDFDLNPSQGLDLVELLRFLQLKNLFVIALGDRDNLEEQLGLHEVGRMARLAEPALLSQKYLDRRSTSFASQKLRKLIPPGQTLSLNARPEPKEQKDAQSSSTQQPSTPESHHCRASCPLIEKLKEVLLHRSGQTGALYDLHTHLGLYPRESFGHQLLHAPARVLTDLHIALQGDLQGEEKTPLERSAYFQALFDVVRYALREDPNLTYSEAERLAASLDFRDGMAMSHERLKLMQHCLPVPVFRDDSDNSAGELVIYHKRRLQLFVRPDSDWTDLQLREQNSSKKQKASSALTHTEAEKGDLRPLHPTASALLALSHDLLQLANEHDVASFDSALKRMDQPCLEWKPKKGQTLKLYNPFRLTFLQVQRFRAYWNQAVSALSKALAENSQTRDELAPGALDAWLLALAYTVQVPNSITKLEDAEMIVQKDGETWNRVSQRGKLGELLKHIREKIKTLKPTNKYTLELDQLQSLERLLVEDGVLEDADPVPREAETFSCARLKKLCTTLDPTSSNSKKPS